MLIDDPENQKFKFQGARVTYGEKYDTDKIIKLAFGFPKLVCLQKNQAAEIFPRYSSAKERTIEFQVNFDFTKYETPTLVNDSYIETKYSVAGGQLCFLYGHFSPFEFSTDLEITMYFTLVTKAEKKIDEGKLLFFSANIAKPVTFHLSNNQIRVVTGEDKMDKLGLQKTLIDDFSCSIKDESGLGFTFSSKDFSFKKEGLFDIVFVDENLTTKATERARVNEERLMISSSDSSLACSKDVPELMFTRYMIKEFSVLAGVKALNEAKTNANKIIF